MHNSFKTKTHDFPWGKTGGGSRAVSHLHLSSPDLLWILWKRLELIVVKAGYPSSLAPATKKHREKRKSGSRPGPFFLDFMDQNRAWFSWDINVLIGTYINVPWNNQKENHGTNILGGFLLVSTAFHTWARILNIYFAKNIFSSNFLAVKSTKKLMEFPWSCRLTKMLW